MTPSIFQTLFFLARPAAGKSEIIHFLENVPLPERMERFHVGKMIPLDDFPMLWSWFEDDDLLSEMGKPRLHTDDEGYFKYPYQWDLLIKRIGLEYRKLQRDTELEGSTVIIEFSRGKEHGGYSSAFRHLDPWLTDKSAILYVDVSWEESLRKNRRRFNPDKPDSILEHGIPDKKLEHMYAETDWFDITKDTKDYLSIAGHDVPYIIFENEDDLTSHIDDMFVERLKRRMDSLWDLYKKLYF